LINQFFIFSFLNINFTVAILAQAFEGCLCAIASSMTQQSALDALTQLVKNLKQEHTQHTENYEAQVYKILSQKAPASSLEDVTMTNEQKKKIEEYRVKNEAILYNIALAKKAINALQADQNDSKNAQETSASSSDQNNMKNVPKKSDSSSEQDDMKNGPETYDSSSDQDDTKKAPRTSASSSNQNNTKKASKTSAGSSNQNDMKKEPRTSASSSDKNPKCRTEIKYCSRMFYRKHCCPSCDRVHFDQIEDSFLFRRE